MENNNQQQNVVTQTSRFAMISVMLCFFAMGFVDLVGTASNYVKQDLGLIATPWPTSCRLSSSSGS